MTDWTIFKLAGCLVVLPLAALAGVNVNVSGSAYVDFMGTDTADARQNSLSGLTPELALKLDVDATDELAVSVRACLGCHGVTLDRFHVEWTPTPAFNVQVGRITVPFGDFTQRYDTSAHRAASKPLIYEMGRMVFGRQNQMNLGVTPTPYGDTGALVYGQVWLGKLVQLWYGAYVVGGFKGENDLDWASMYQSYFNDNNRIPSGGARVVLTYSAEVPGAVLKDVSLGVSGMGGGYDRAHTRNTFAFAADLSARIGPITARAEVALRRTDINPNLPGYRLEVIDPWIEKSGFYVELEHALFDRVLLGYRFDGLQRAGVPLPGADPRLQPVTLLLRYTQAVQVNIITGLFAKGSYEYWLPSPFGSAHVFHLGLGGVF